MNHGFLRVLNAAASTVCLIFAFVCFQQHGSFQDVESPEFYISQEAEATEKAYSLLYDSAEVAEQHMLEAEQIILGNPNDTMLEQLNQQRTTMGAPPLMRDDHLNALAEEQILHLNECPVLGASELMTYVSADYDSDDLYGVTVLRGTVEISTVMKAATYSMTQTLQFCNQDFTKIGIGCDKKQRMWVLVFA